MTLFISLPTWPIVACKLLRVTCATQNLSNPVLPQIKLRSPLLKQKLMIGLLINLLVFTPLKAQTFSELEIMLEQHPRLQAMKYQAISDRELASSAIGLPDPVIGFGINNFPIFDPSFDEFIPTNKSIGIKQRFPSRSLRRARSAKINAQADQINEQFEQLFSSLRSELVALLHKKAEIKQTVRLATQRDIKYQQLNDLIEADVGGGRTSVFRLAEIEAERAEVSRLLAELKAQTTQVDSRLLYLLGTIPTTTPPPEINPVYVLNDDMVFYAAKVASSAVKASDSGIAEAKAQWKPEWGLDLTYQQREAGTNFEGDDFVSVMVSFSVPIWSKSNQAPKLRAANAKQQAAKAALSEAQRKALAQYTYAKATYSAALEKAEILKQKIISIKKEIAAQQSSYESGKGTFAPIIDGEITILKLEAEIVIEQSRSQIAAAQMNALVVSQ